MSQTRVHFSLLIRRPTPTLSVFLLHRNKLFDILYMEATTLPLLIGVTDPQWLGLLVRSYRKPLVTETRVVLTNER